MFKKNKKSKQKKKPQRQRKTYSIHGNKATRDTSDNIERKRKSHREEVEDESKIKLRKVDENKVSDSSSDEEEEVEDPIKQLRASFSGGF